MRKQYNRLIAGVLTAALCFGIAGCTSTEQEDSLVYLDYGVGMEENGEYNTKLYGFNENDVEDPDPGCFYVSEEEDPVYGGYFYMYPTSFATNEGGLLKDEYYKKNKIKNLVATCYRSKDLYNWERCGVLEKGYVCVIDEEDWCQDYWWAPEVIRNPADGKYYLYFNAITPQDYGVPYLSNSSNKYDRFYIGVAVSDSPMGPFDVLYDIDQATGKRIPTINFQLGCNTEYNWSVIDINPFFDDNGDFYLYFNKHTDDHYTHLNGVFGMKMKSMTVPDYSTVSCLTQAGKVTASNTPGELENIKEGENYFATESGINEAPFMMKHNGKYYLTYSSNGFAHIGYSVHQAVSDNPLSGFEKLSQEQGNPVLDGSVLGHMNGTGHHAFAKKGDELYVIYHRHGSIYGWNESSMGRYICADRVHFVTNSEGMEVLTASGPTKGLVWLAEDISGYKNLAQEAEVKISAGSGVQYLTDGLLPFYTVVQDRFMEADGDVTITFSWKEPVSINSLMIYNAQNVNSAFSKIADVRFKLAADDAKYDYAVIKDLAHPTRYWNAEKEEYIPCAPAVAEFDSLLVSEVSITINAKDRWIKENKKGQINTALQLSEIVILGGVENNE